MQRPRPVCVIIIAMPPEDQFQRMVCFVDDLIFASKIEGAARQSGFVIEWIGKAAEIAPLESGAWQRQAAEHLIGPGAALIERISAWRPVLLLFDLNNTAIPWREWLPLLKSVPATRRYPAICYGSHVDVTAIQTAQSCGADAVFARSRFVRDLPQIIRKYALIPDYAAMDNACREALSHMAVHGLELFNKGAYFEAHEALEEAWNEDQGAGRELYRAILQVAVAYLQIERGNYNGAIKMFWRVRQWIEPLPERCRGVDVALLREDAHRVYNELLLMGKDKIADLDRGLLRPVVYAREEL